MPSEVTDFEEKGFGATSINPDGMMILVWTDDRHKKHKTDEEIKIDHDSLESPQNSKPLIFPVEILRAFP